MGGLKGGGREKGKLSAPKGKRESSHSKKGKGKSLAHRIWDPIPLGNQTARTHARTKGNDFPREHPPTSDLSKNMKFEFWQIVETLQPRKQTRTRKTKKPRNQKWRYKKTRNQETKKPRNQEPRNPPTPHLPYVFASTASKFAKTSAESSLL